MPFTDYSLQSDKVPVYGQSTPDLTLVLSSAKPAAFSGESFYLTLTVLSETPFDITQLTLNQIEGTASFNYEAPTKVNDYQYLIAAVLIGEGINQLQASLDQVTSDGVYVELLAPSIPSTVDFVNTVKQDYASYIQAVSSPKISTLGTKAGKHTTSGTVDTLLRDGKSKAKQITAGATQEATARLRGLSEVLSGNHLANEVTQLESWVVAQGNPIDITPLETYRDSVVLSQARLTSSLKNYSYGDIGSSVIQSSAADNRSAQSFRFTSGSVFDIYSPTTLINSEYLVQQGSKATFRQTAIDQLSSLFKWSRAENTEVRQAKDYYSYTTNNVVEGGKQKLEVYEDADLRYNHLAIESGLGIDINSVVDFSLFSALNVWTRAIGGLYQSAKDFVLNVANSVYLYGLSSFAIKSEGTVRLMGSRVILDSDCIIFKSKNPIQIMTGEGPEFLYTGLTGMTPVVNPELMQQPVLSIAEVSEGNAAGIISASQYLVSVVLPMEPLFKPLVYPIELLDYPKSGLPKQLVQPFSGVVSSPVSPSVDV